MTCIKLHTETTPITMKAVWRNRTSKSAHQWLSAASPERMIMRLRIDPLADQFPNMSPYNYCYGIPVWFIDPTSMKGESTHTDENGKVIAVYKDGDIGVYRHKKNADGSSVTKSQIEKRHQSSNSAGGEKMGKTEYWDEFIVPGSNDSEGQIEFNTSWDPLIEWGNNRAKNQDLTITMEESKNNQILDIKTGDWAYAGVMTGRLLDGKYATARSAGNYLAGLNGVTGTLQGQYISGETYMKLAGAYQQRQLTKINIAKILTLGTSFGPAPYYGEETYSGRMILKGIQSVNKRP